MNIKISVPVTLFWNWLIKKIRKDEFHLHEKEIFRRFDEILNEYALEDTLDSLGGLGSYSTHQIEPIRQIQKFYRGQSNLFLDKQLHRACEKFISDISILHAFVIQHFYRYPNYPGQNHEDITYRLEPDRRDDDEFMDRVLETLRFFVKQSRNSYSVFRSLIREKLLV